MVVKSPLSKPYADNQRLAEKNSMQYKNPTKAKTTKPTKKTTN